jgi:hypothetical protein
VVIVASHVPFALGEVPVTESARLPQPKDPRSSAAKAPDKTHVFMGGEHRPFRGFGQGGSEVPSQP